MGNIPGGDLYKSLGAVIVASTVFLLLRTIARRRANIIRNIPGPPSPSWLLGNLPQIFIADQYGDHEFAWQKVYGAVYRVKGCFGENRLMVSDPAAMQFIVNSPKFDFSPANINTIKLMHHKKSLIVAKGEYHRRLRAALNPSFSAAGVREYQPIILKAAEEMAKQLENSTSQLVDVSPLLATVTLSAISEAVLGCTVQELDEEFVQLTSRVVELGTRLDAGSILFGAIAAHFPDWVWELGARLPTGPLNDLRKGQHLAKRIGKRLVRDKIAAARQGLEMNNDVYSELLKGGQSDGKTLTEEEVAAQTSLMVVAGQETAAGTLAFGLLELARHPDFQESLRHEIHSTLGGKPPSSDVVYNNMPLLNAFIKEVLRLYPILALEERIALEDTILPVAESITTRTGERLSHIPIQKGQIVTLALASYQRLESLWGADAAEFKPSRWIEGTTYKGDAIGPYANLLAFFGGPRTCLGWRFAVLEMQVILCEVVGKFSFAPAEGEPARPYGSSMIAPVLATGEKGAVLHVTRVL